MASKVWFKARRFRAQEKQRAALALLRIGFRVGFFLVAVMKGRGWEIVLLRLHYG
jgi:hypothetical protein